jgi:FkbM family methyltransferase
MPDFGCRIALPIIRREIPGWGKIAAIFSIFGAEKSGSWNSAPWMTVRGKWHGYDMDLNLADWSERQTWFLARYHELDLQLLMNACLRPGDRVIDVGANIGMLSLHAAWRVGPTGRVESFEPNPECCRRIRTVLDRNAIRHVRLHEMGLSDSSATLTLSVLENHAGMATLAPVEKGHLHVTSTVEVPVRVGDEVLQADARPLTLVKVDVEGFEVRVLRGLRETLSKHRPIVVTEIIPEWLERAGASVAELAELMRNLGYDGFGLGTRRKGLKHGLKLIPWKDANVLPPGVSDVVWAPKDGSLRERLDVPR